MEANRSNNLNTPSLPLLVRLSLFLFSFAMAISRRSNLTVNRSLFRLFDFKVSPSSKPRRGVKSSDFTVDPTRRLWFRLYTPSTTSATNLPVVIFFHGGGFAFMSACSKPYDDICRRWARLIPAVVISVNYRLSPEHKYPSPYQDGLDTLTFLDNYAVDCPSDHSRCFLAGDSAGANIAHHVALRAKSHTFRNLKVRGLLSLQPFIGGEERTKSEMSLDKKTPLLSLNLTDWMWKAFLPEGSDRDHPAANIKGPDFSSGDFPPTLIVVGGCDILQDRQRLYFETLKASGSQPSLLHYPSAVHAFYLFPQLPDSTLLDHHLRDFINAHSTS